MNKHTLRDNLGRFAPLRPPVKRPLTKLEKKVEEMAKGAYTILNFFLLDDTASMQSKTTATIDGFNKTLYDTRDAAKANDLVNEEILALFGEHGHFVIKDRLNSISAHTYFPNRNHTALWWAAVEAIHHIENMLLSRPITTNVVLTIFTDGENNDAYQYQSICKDLIAEKQRLGWVITFMGAGEEHFVRQQSDSVGIYASNTAAYANTVAGTRSAFEKLSRGRTKYAQAVADGVQSNVGFFAE